MLFRIKSWEEKSPTRGWLGSPWSTGPDSDNFRPVDNNFSIPLLAFSFASFSCLALRRVCAPAKVVLPANLVLPESCSLVFTRFLPFPLPLPWEGGGLILSSSDTTIDRSMA